MRRLIPILALAGTLSSGITAQAQFSTTQPLQEDALSYVFRRCLDTSLTPDARITACQTAAGASGITSEEQAFANSNLALALEARGDNQAALDALNKAAQLEPDAWQIYANRIGLYTQLNQLENARNDYETLTKIDVSKLSMKVANYGEYRSRPVNGKSDSNSSESDATQYQTALTQIKGELANAYAFRCQQKQRADANSADALRDCDTSISLSSADGRVFELRGFIHLQRHELPAAHADFDSALQSNPKSAKALYLRAIVEHDQGDAADAKADMISANAIDPKIEQEFQQRN